MKLLKFCLLFGGLAVQTLARTGPALSVRTTTSKKVSACPVGEIRKSCRSKCEPTCFSNAKCATICSPNAVCTCQEGFVRHEGICIPKAACQFFARPPKKTQQRPQVKPTAKKTKTSGKSSEKKKFAKSKPTVATPPPEVIIKPAHPPPSCGRGQAFTLCVCDASCDAGKVCKACKSGCGCFRHFVRDSTGDCIAFEQCPLPRPLSKPMAIIDLTDEKPGGSRAEGIKTIILTSDNFHARIPQHEAERFLRLMNARIITNSSHSLSKKSDRQMIASALLANSISLHQSSNIETTTSSRQLQRQPFPTLISTLSREFFPTRHMSFTRKPRQFRHKNNFSHERRLRNSLLSSLLRFSKRKETDPTLDNLFPMRENVRTVVPISSKGPIPPPTTIVLSNMKHATKIKKIKSPMSPAIKPASESEGTEIGAPSAKPSSHISTGPVPPALVRRLREKSRGMPPGKTPPMFGPPAMTPFVFFREKRVERRRNKLTEMKEKLPWLRKNID